MDVLVWRLEAIESKKAVRLEYPAESGFGYFKNRFLAGPMSAEWDPPRDLRLGNPKGRLRDFLFWTGGVPVVSERARELIAGLPLVRAEFLPLLTIRGVDYYAVNAVHLIDCLDVGTSDIVYSPHEPGRILNIHGFRFVRDRLEGVPIFKVPHDISEIFVTQSFVECVLDKGLTGAEFADPSISPFVWAVMDESRKIGALKASGLLGPWEERGIANPWHDPDEERAKSRKEKARKVNIDIITDHVEKHIGRPVTVIHPLVSREPHIDILHVHPTRERPYHTLVTAGMSDRAMKLPKGETVPRYAELMLSLPADWPMTSEAWQDERNYWPIRWLLKAAQLPHEENSWVAIGHTLADDDPPPPLCHNSRFCAVLISFPMLPSEEFLDLKLSDSKTISFYALIPIYPEELRHANENEPISLPSLLEDAGVTECVDASRRAVCG